MVRKPDATVPPAPQDIQLVSKHRVLSLKPQLRLEWRAQDGQNETEQPHHSASLGDSIPASTQIRFSVHTGPSHVTSGLPPGRPEVTADRQNDAIGSRAQRRKVSPSIFRPGYS